MRNSFTVAGHPQSGPAVLLAGSLGLERTAAASATRRRRADARAGAALQRLFLPPSHRRSAAPGCTTGGEVRFISRLARAPALIRLLERAIRRSQADPEAVRVGLAERRGGRPRAARRGGVRGAPRAGRAHLAQRHPLLLRAY